MSGFSLDPNAKADPMRWDTPIVDEAGRPTLEFQRKFNAQRAGSDAVATGVSTVQAAAEAAQTAATAAQTSADNALSVASSKPDSFLGLTDTPDTYAGQAGKFPKVNATEDALEFDVASAVAAFLDLTDTPSTYTGAASKAVQVKSDESGLEFVVVGAGTGVQLDRDRYGPPEAADFPTIVGTNSENPTVTDTTSRGMVIAFGTSPAAGDNVRQVLKAKASSTDYDIIARIEPSMVQHDYNSAGIAVSDGTKLVTFGIGNRNSTNLGTTIKVARWTNQTTFSSDRLAGSAMFFPQWLRIGIVGSKPTNFYISQNGTDWIEVLSEDQSGFLTYTSVGFYIHMTRSSTPSAVSGTQQAIADVLYYSDPDITPTVRYPGVKGDTGATGATGAGVVAGGTAHQALTKIDATDFNTQWETVDKTFVGLGSVDNTADAAKNVLSATKLTTARNIDGQAFDGTADITVIAPGTHAATSKATPVDADELPLVDSAASNVLKKLTWANLKATLKTYLDTLYLSLGGGTLTGALILPSGSAGVPSLGVGAATTGLYSDTANAVTITANSARQARFNPSNLTLFGDGGTYTLTQRADGGCQYLIERCDATQNAGNFTFRKARGTISSRAAVTMNDQAFTLVGQAYGGAGYLNVFNLFCQITEPTPGTTAMGSRAVLQVTPLGSTTLTEIMRWEHATGLSMFGANPVIGPNRHFWLREYASASLPSATQSSMLASSSDIPGGAITSDGTGWHSPGVKRLRTVTANTSFSVPAGWAISAIHFAETAGNAVTGGVKIGTTSGATDVVAAQAVGASAIGSISDANILLKVFSRTVAQTLFVQAVTSWNSASVEFSFVLRKVF